MSIKSQEDPMKNSSAVATGGDDLCHAAETAQRPDLFPLWDPKMPFPSHEEMPDLDAVTHVAVERAQPEGWHYLHESSPAWHKGALYVCWANHKDKETNSEGEIIRGRRSLDGGFSWEAASVWMAPSAGGSSSYNCPVLFERDGLLWGFFTRWDLPQNPAPKEEWVGVVGPELPSTEIFSLDDDTGAWQRRGLVPGFIPFSTPRRLADGNWIISGEEYWYKAAVIISRGDDFSSWEMVTMPKPENIKMLFPETALMEQGSDLLALVRTGTGCVGVARSVDLGRSWSDIELSNFPMCSSMPFCGRLSSGHQYLISNGHHLDEGRFLLSLAVAAPGERLFSRVFKLRHQCFPLRRHFPGYAWVEGGQSHVGTTTEWSYPSAVEHEGNLYISYTQGKEDCWLSIVPIWALTGRGGE